MGALLAEHLDPIGQGGLQPGDILWLVVDVDPQHLAIVTAIMPEITIIHAFAHGGINKVVEHNAAVLQILNPLVADVFGERLSKKEFGKVEELIIKMKTIGYQV